MHARLTGLQRRVLEVLQSLGNTVTWRLLRDESGATAYEVAVALEALEQAGIVRRFGHNCSDIVILLPLAGVECLARPVVEPIKRRCLGCGKRIKSRGPHHRQCNNCRKSATRGRSGVDGFVGNKGIWRSRV